jgi:hypothetical protein
MKISPRKTFIITAVSKDGSVTRRLTTDAIHLKAVIRRADAVFADYPTITIIERRHSTTGPVARKARGAWRTVTTP